MPAATTLGLRFGPAWRAPPSRLQAVGVNVRLLSPRAMARLARRSTPARVRRNGSGPRRCLKSAGRHRGRVGQPDCRSAGTHSGSGRAAVASGLTPPPIYIQNYMYGYKDHRRRFTGL